MVITPRFPAAQNFSRNSVHLAHISVGTTLKSGSLFGRRQQRWREKLTGKPLILHADNGAAQRSQTLRAKLRDLGIEPSYGRPGVSDDNAFIESLFRTLKYVPAYPSAGFADLEAARAWTQRFVDWYNDQHRHRAIGFVTPNQRHSGQSAAILARRREVYLAARQANPARWSAQIRRWSEPDEVVLNKREEARKTA